MAYGPYSTSPAGGGGVSAGNDGQTLITRDGVVQWGGVPTGFASAALTDHYAADTVGVAPGADDFIVIVLATSFAIDLTKVQIIAENRDGSTGWRIAWEYGFLVFSAFDGSGSNVQAPAGVNNYLIQQAKGHLHALALRARQVTGALEVTGWCGPVQVAAAVTGAAGMDPATGGTLQLATGTAFGDEAALNGAVFGLGYVEGTLTDAELRELLGRAITYGDIPTDAAPLDLVYSGETIAALPATWSPVVGTGDLDRAGSPTSEIAYFPPV